MGMIFFHRNIQNCISINFEGLFINLAEPVLCFVFVFVFFSIPSFLQKSTGGFKNSLGISKFTYTVKIVAL